MDRKELADMHLQIRRMCHDLNAPIRAIHGFAEILLRRDTASLDGRGGEPSRLLGLKTEVAEDDAIPAGGVTSYTTSLAFSVLDPLGHQRHRHPPRTCLG